MYTYIYSMEGAFNWQADITAGHDSSKLPRYASEQAKAMVAMKDMLPQYVTDSFVATGYDTLLK